MRSRKAKIMSEKNIHFLLRQVRHCADTRTRKDVGSKGSQDGSVSKVRLGP